MLISIVSFVIVFTIVALVHEFGHFLAAKRAGIKVQEFALGFGPQLWSFKKGETIYALNLIPILAYVRIAGMEDEFEDKDCPEDQKYYSKPLRQKFLVSFLGPFMNIVLAFLILTTIFTLFGVPKEISNEIEKVVPNSPAEKAGLKSGDRLLSVDGTPVVKMDNAIEYIHNHSGKSFDPGGVAGKDLGHPESGAEV